jgi:serine/threonine-protein kinase RsbW
VKKQTLKIDSRTDQLVTVRDFIARAAYASGFNDEDVSKIALAVDEACTNVIKHAYHFDSKRKITITVQNRDRDFEVVIMDTGKKFDPSKITIPNMKEYLSKYKRGGLGVYLMRSLMDKVEYDIEPGKRNRVRLVKHLPR